MAAPARAVVKHYAVVVGNNAAPIAGEAAALPTLRYSDDDAVRVRQLLERLRAQTALLTVLDAETQRRYPGLAEQAEPPTLARLLDVVQTFRAAMEQDRSAGDTPVFYFFFSGHGAIGDEGHAYLAMQDGGLHRAQLYDAVIAALPAAYTHLIIDACHAGAVVGARGLFDRELDAQHAPVTEAEAQAVVGEDPTQRFPGLGYLVATTQGQEAHEWSRYEAGVFTHELLSALSGAADVNGDGHVEYSEVQAFVAAANREVRDPRALPRVVSRPPARNHNVPLVVLDALYDTVLLSGDPSRLGRFHVELDDGQRLLDAHLAGLPRTALALPAGRRLFVRTDQREAELRTASGGRIDMTSLAFAPRSTKARGSLDAAFRESLFSAPYTPAYYKGYVDSTGTLGVRFELNAELKTQSDEDPLAWRGPTSIGLAGLAGAMTVAAVVTGTLAGVAYMDFQSTQLQRQAHDANQRFVIFANSALVTGVAAALAGGAAWLVWPPADE